VLNKLGGRSITRPFVDRAAVIRAAVESLETRRLFSFQLNVAFEFGAATSAPGYEADSGSPYFLHSSGNTFGWTANNTGAFDRGSSGTPDIRYRTGITTKTGGTDRTWEAAVPNGSYYVHLVAGDSTVSSGTYAYNVEGTSAFLSGTATSSKHWIEAAGTVSVTDGKLTIANNSAATAFALAYVEITDAHLPSSLNAPTDLVAKANWTDQIDLRWTDNNVGEGSGLSATGSDITSSTSDSVGYEVQRSTNGTIWSTLSTAAFGNAGLFGDNGRSTNTQYYYRVRAKAGSVTSAWSASVSATTLANTNQAGFVSGRTLPTTSALVIESEDHDYGGNGVGYNDGTASGNFGGYYRSGKMDIGYNASAARYFTGWTGASEWAEYSLAIPTGGGNYYIDTTLASGGTGGSFKADLRSTTDTVYDTTATMSVPDTGSWTSYQTVRSDVLTVSTGGNAILRISGVTGAPVGAWVADFDKFVVHRFDAPSVLSFLSSTTSAASLSWTDNTTNETGFALERSTTSDFTTGTVTSIAIAANATGHTDTGLSSNTQYWYRLRASATGVGNTAWSAATSGSTQTGATVPSAPSSLAVTGTSATSATLAWTDNASNETGFTLQRSLSSAFTSVTTIAIPANTTSYTNSGLANGTTYYYRLAATNAQGTSLWSNSASGTTATPSATLPAAPTFSTVYIDMAGEANVRWRDVSDNEAGFRLYGITGSSATLLGTASADTTSARFAGVGGLYSGFRLRSFNSQGETEAIAQVITNHVIGIDNALSPTTLTDTIVSGQHVITANPISQAVDVIEISTDGGVAYFPYATMTNPISFPANEPGTYLFRGSTAVDGSSTHRPYSTPLTLTTTMPAPANLTATEVSGNQLRLDWSFTGTYAEGFRIRRSMPGGNWAEVGRVTDGSVRTLTLSNVPAGTAATYEVVAFNTITANGALAYSAGVIGTSPSATVPDGTYLALFAEAINASAVKLYWFRNFGSTYEIYRSTNSTFSPSQETLLATTQLAFYADSGLDEGVTYFYQVLEIRSGTRVFWVRSDSATPSEGLTAVSSFSVTSTSGNVGYWQHVALERAGISEGRWNINDEYFNRPSPRSDNVANVRRVYDYYQDLNQRNRSFQWAGMARLAGGPVVRGLQNAHNVGTGLHAWQALNEMLQGNWPEIEMPGGVAAYARYVERVLLFMQKSVFLDIAWQHEAYLQSGLEELTRLRDAGEMPQDSYSAWQLIDSGIRGDDQTRIWDGNILLLRREQEVALAEGFRLLSTIPLLADALGIFVENPFKNPVTNGQPFDGTGPLTRFDDRWAWIQTEMVTPWRALPQVNREFWVDQPLDDLVEGF